MPENFGTLQRSELLWNMTKTLTKQSSMSFIYYIRITKNRYFFLSAVYLFVQVTGSQCRTPMAISLHFFFKKKNKHITCVSIIFFAFEKYSRITINSKNSEYLSSLLVLLAKSQSHRQWQEVHHSWRSTLS